MSAQVSSWRSLLPSRQDYLGLRRTWKRDVLAGLTVGIVALPLALAFGVSSGAGAEAGLITAIVAGLVAAIFGGSHVQVSGPTGAMVVVLAPIVMNYGAGALMVVSVMAGIVVLIAGLLRLGRTVSYIPWPVVEGFTMGIGIIIFAQQVPAAVGASDAAESPSAVVAAVQAITAADWPQALLPLAAVVVVAGIMVLAGRRWPQIPGSFLAIVVVTAVVVLASVPLENIGALPSSLPAPALPEIDLEIIRALAGPALAVAALAAIESLLSGRVAHSMSEVGPFDADRELVGQGLASVASGIFGGMPATAAIARTAVNVRSGARTRVSAIVHALALLAVVYLAAQAVSHVPLAALSGVLMVTASRMVSVRVARTLLTTTRSDAAIFLITAVVTVSVDLVVAILIGLAVAAFFALRALSRASGVHREEIAGPVHPGDARIAVFRIDGALFFGAVDRIIERVSAQKGLDVVVLRLSQLHLVDATGARSLATLVTALEERGVTVLIKGVRPEHLNLMRRLQVFAALRHRNHLFDDLDDAVAHARSHIRRIDAERAEQAARDQETEQETERGKEVQQDPELAVDEHEDGADEPRAASNGRTGTSGAPTSGSHHDDTAGAEQPLARASHDASG
ncbi:MAG TPA: SulP family inorganic anion transporter [Beutenbergiaceae bacterium]|nr:SulP family inorganic anion transporter [Beutenbergiaceae bacterium]